MRMKHLRCLNANLWSYHDMTIVQYLGIESLLPTTDAHYLTNL